MRLERDARAHVGVQLVAGEMRPVWLTRRNRDRQFAENVEFWSRKEYVNDVGRLEVLWRSDEPYRYVEDDAHRQRRRDHGIDLDTEQVQKTPAKGANPLTGDRPDDPQRYSLSEAGGEPRAAST